MCIRIYVGEKETVCVCVCVCRDTYMSPSLSIHPINGHLGSLGSLAIVDIAAMNTGVQVPRWITPFVSLG